MRHDERVSSQIEKTKNEVGLERGIEIGNDIQHTNKGHMDVMM